MRLLLFIIAFLLCHVASAQATTTIYEKAPWSDPNEEPTCPVVRQDLIDLMNQNVKAQETTSNYTYVDDYSFTTTNSGDRCTVYLSYRYCSVNRTNSSFKNCNKTGTLTESGPIEFSYLCSDHPYTVAYYPEGAEKPRCYSEDELADVDSCPDNVSANSYVLPASAGAASSICSTPSDDLSSCHYNLSETGDFYVASFENTQCYNGATTAQPYTPDPPPDGYCNSGDDGYLMCNENPSNVCDADGNCQSGCGSYSYDGVEAFVCFSDDKDLDGVPDYSDTDIDGDGIPNSEDEDWDGDGLNDPEYGSGRDGSSGTNTGGTGQTSGQTNINTSGIESRLDAIKDSIDGIAETPFTIGAEGRAEGYSGLFSDEWLQGLTQKKDELSSQLNNTYSTIQSDMNGLFSLDDTGATFQARSMVVKGVNVDYSLSRWADPLSILGSVMLFISTVAAFFIVLGGKND